MKTLSVILVAGACAACATTPVPADKYARARAAITTAEVMNVDQQPNAALHLRLAKDQLEQGKRLLQDGENERASHVLLRAEADAQVAVSLARETWAKRDAIQTMEQISKMQAQMEGTTP
jgi:hypothetical protein